MSVRGPDLAPFLTAGRDWLRAIFPNPIGTQIDAERALYLLGEAERTLTIDGSADPKLWRTHRRTLAEMIERFLANPRGRGICLSRGWLVLLILAVWWLI